MPKYYQEIKNIHRGVHTKELATDYEMVVKFRTTSMLNFLMKCYLLLEPLLELI
jgi:hypothetical protein